MKPKWLTDLIANSDEAVARVLRGDPPPCEHRTCLNEGYGICFGVVAAMRDFRDDTNPDRECGHCFHPRNSEECNFAAGHLPYVEMFGE